MYNNFSYMITNNRLHVSYRPACIIVYCIMYMSVYYIQCCTLLETFRALQLNKSKIKDNDEILTRNECVWSGGRTLFKIDEKCTAYTIDRPGVL